MVKAFFQFIKEHKAAYLIGGILAVISGILAIVPNYIIQLFIDSILSQTLNAGQLSRLLLIFAGTALVIYMVDVIWLITLFSKSTLFPKQLRQSLYRRLLTLRTPFYEKYRSGDLITRMTSDIDALGDTLAWGFLIVVSDGTWIVSLLTVMVLTVSWQITLMAVIPLLIFGVVVYYLGMEVDRRYEKSRDSVAQLANEVLEVVDGVRVMRAYGKKELEQARFQERTRQVVTKADALVLLNGLFAQLARLFTGLSTALGLTIGAYKVNQGQLTIGQLITFQIYLGMLNGAIWGMADLVAIYQQGKVSYRKIQELETADDLLEKNGKEILTQIERIDFNHYSFTYPADERATLSNVTFTLHRGQTLGIVGKTGSGKSTLIRQLLRQYPVENPAALTINSLPITAIKRESLESLIGYVPQDHILFSKTVKENILFGKHQATQDHLTQAIQSADFTKDIQHMAQGLETLIGEKGVALSGGQKQRVSMARALIREPDLLILDDSLSAVDAKTERAIIQNIQNLRQSKTNIIITHRLSAVAHADLVLVVEEGRIIEAGSPQYLIEQSGWYAEQFQRQQLEEDQKDAVKNF